MKSFRISPTPRRQASPRELRQFRRAKHFLTFIRFGCPIEERIASPLRRGHAVFRSLVFDAFFGHDERNNVFSVVRESAAPHNGTIAGIPTGVPPRACAVSLAVKSKILAAVESMRAYLLYVVAKNKGNKSLAASESIAPDAPHRSGQN